MDSESERKTESASGGIPVKASKPGGASIRMTRSRESEPENSTPREKMADEEKKPEETPNSEEATKPKLPPKKQAVAPPEKPEPESDAGASASSAEKSEKKTDESPEKKTGGDDQTAGQKVPKLPPKTGSKPKLTPKIPASPLLPLRKSPLPQRRNPPPTRLRRPNLPRHRSPPNHRRQPSLRRRSHMSCGRARPPPNPIPPREVRCCGSGSLFQAKDHRGFPRGGRHRYRDRYRRPCRGLPDPERPPSPPLTLLELWLTI